MMMQRIVLRSVFIAMVVSLLGIGPAIAQRLAVGLRELRAAAAAVDLKPRRCS